MNDAITNSLPSILIALAVLAILAFALYAMYRQKRSDKGCCSCGGSCSGCSGACHCESPESGAVQLNGYGEIRIRRVESSQ